MTSRPSRASAGSRCPWWRPTLVILPDPGRHRFNLPPAPIPGLGLNPSYYLTLQVDPSNAAAESDLGDKQGQGQGIDTAVVTITPHPVPFLIVTAVLLSTFKTMVTNGPFAPALISQVIEAPSRTSS